MSSSSPSADAASGDALVARLSHAIAASAMKDAIASAALLKERYGYRDARRPALWLSVALACATFLVSERLAVRVARLAVRTLRLCRLGRGQAPPWAHARAIQLAYYWQNLHQAESCGLVQLAVAPGAAERARAAAWLAYAGCYLGGSRLGRRVLARVVARARREGWRDCLHEALSLQAIGVHMLGEPRASLALHAEFDRECTDSSQLWKLLSVTTRINALMQLGELAAAGQALERAYAEAFSLYGSRHHVQVFGWKAVLAASSGDSAAARAHLDESRRAAQRADTPLEWMIYWRLAAIVAYVVGEYHGVERALVDYRRALIAFGNPRWFAAEWRRLKAAVNAGAPYFSTEAVLAWQRSRQKLAYREAVDLKSLAHRLVSFGTTAGAVINAKDATLQETVAALCAAFPVAELFAAETRDGLLAAVRAYAPAADFGGVPEAGDRPRVHLGGRRYFLGCIVQAPGEGGATQAAGIVVDSGSDFVLALAESYLELLVSQYAYAQAEAAVRSREIETKQYQAVAQTIQMLAHDVRKPFSLLKAAVAATQAAATPEASRRAVSVFVPEVERAMGAVTAMLEDVMAMGAGGVGAEEPLDPARLLAAQIQDVFRLHPPRGVRFAGACAHTVMVAADGAKLGRVFANILDNARQAVDAGGTIRLATRDVACKGRPCVEIRIGNTGSTVAAEDRERIFEPFFTKGKRGGTGLGLAIAKKIVTAHGGSVRCEAEPGHGVDFVITLPAMERPADPATWPPDAAAVCQVGPGPGSAGPVSRTAPPAVGAAAKPLKVALLDDDPFMCEAWKMALPSVDLCTFASAAALRAALVRTPALLDGLDAFVTDYYLGEKDADGGPVLGSDVAAMVKGMRRDLPILLASDADVEARDLASFDGVIAKDPPAAAALAELIAARRGGAAP